MSASLEKLLSKIKVAFVGDDENLTQEAKKACVKTKKFTAQGYNEGLRELETIKNSDIILCELKNSHSLEFIEDISYENPRVKIIALERISSQNGGGGGSCDFVTQLLDSNIFLYLPSPVNARGIEIALAHFSHLHCKNSLVKFSPALAVDKLERQIYKNSKPLLLSPKLRRIFWLLFDNLNKVVSHYTIIDAIDENMCINSLRMAIVRLKKLLQNKELIANVPGDGYMLVFDEKHALKD